MTGWKCKHGACVCCKPGQNQMKSEVREHFFKKNIEDLKPD